MHIFELQRYYKALGIVTVDGQDFVLPCAIVVCENDVFKENLFVLNGPVYRYISAAPHDMTTRLVSIRDTTGLQVDSINSTFRRSRLSISPFVEPQTMHTDKYTEPRCTEIVRSFVTAATQFA